MELLYANTITQHYISYRMLISCPCSDGSKAARHEEAGQTTDGPEEASCLQFYANNIGAQVTYIFGLQ